MAKEKVVKSSQDQKEKDKLIPSFFIASDYININLQHSHFHCANQGWYSVFLLLIDLNYFNEEIIDKHFYKGCLPKNISDLFKDILNKGTKDYHLNNNTIDIKHDKQWLYSDNDKKFTCTFCNNKNLFYREWNKHYWLDSLLKDGKDCDKCSKHFKFKVNKNNDKNRKK